MNWGTTRPARDHTVHSGQSAGPLEWYYHFSRIGDPVTWTNTGTTKRVPVWDGYGDWNLSWTSYRQGGLLSPAA